MHNIICTVCGCVYGGVGGWFTAMLNGWVWKRVKGIEHVFCPKHNTTKIEGE